MAKREKSLSYWIGFETGKADRLNGSKPKPLRLVMTGKVDANVDDGLKGYRAGYRAAK